MRTCDGAIVAETCGRCERIVVRVLVRPEGSLGDAALRQVKVGAVW